MRNLLIVDDEKSVRESFRMLFKNRFNVLLAESGEKALETIHRESIDIILLDLLIPDLNGMEILKEIKKLEYHPLVIVITAVRSIKTAVEAMKLGAYDYITKPFDIDEVRIVVEKADRTLKLREELNFLRKEVTEKYGFHSLIGKSKVMKDVFSTIMKVADNNATVLITGESGTGKELVARAIHFQGKRKEGPFIPVHCASIPENLLESELFGYEKGAFTGANRNKPGRFSLAEGGTLFLDEIGEMPFSLQSKLLRVLEEKEFVPVGGTRSKKVDVRIIAATLRNLEAMVSEGTFREDLYYRLNVVPLYLPPLRERREDIPLLTSYFLKKYCQEMHYPVKKISPEAMEIFLNYTWPGNVRELENTIERIIVLFPKVKEILPEHLPKNMYRNRKKEVKNGNLPTLKEAISNLEKEMILEALKRSDGVQARAAKLLGTTRRILRYKMEKLGIRELDKNVT